MLICSQIMKLWWKKSSLRVPVDGFRDIQPANKPPNQPRKYIDLDRLAELEASVSRRGVRDSVVVTPVSMAPWSGLEEGDVRPFLIVSGHRRTAASVKAGLQAVPYVVRVYASKSEFERDAEVLNDHRENLSEIEEGWSYRNRIARQKNAPSMIGKTYLMYAESI